MNAEEAENKVDTRVDYDGSASFCMLACIPKRMLKDEPIWEEPDGGTNWLELRTGDVVLGGDEVFLVLQECPADCLHMVKRVSRSWRDCARRVLCSAGWAVRRSLSTDWFCTARALENRSKGNSFIEMVHASEVWLQHASMSPDNGIQVAVLLALSRSITALRLNGNASYTGSICGAYWDSTNARWEGEYDLRGWKALCERLVHFPKLVSLQAKVNYIGSEGASLLAQSLSKMGELRQLVLDSNRIGGYIDNDGRLVNSSMGIESLSGGLSASLLHLSLSDNGMDACSIETLCCAFSQVPLLTRLDLDCNLLLAAGARSLGTRLHLLERLRWLDVSSDALMQSHGVAQPTCHGVAVLTRGLASCPALTFLNMAGNALGLSGVAEVAKLLPRLKQLASLTLSINSIGSDGGRELASVLPLCAEISSLGLSGNQLGPSGVKLLARGLAHLPKLTALDLHNNVIMCAGAKELARALPSAVSLSELNVAGNQIKPATKSMLKAVASMRRGFTLFM